MVYKCSWSSHSDWEMDDMKRALALFTFLLFGLVFSLSQAASGQDADIAVVVNPANGTSSLTVGELRKIFAGEKRSWTGGTPIKLLARAVGTRERTAMLDLMSMKEDDYNRYWTTMMYRGEAQSQPPALPSIGMVKEAMKAYPGAIALVDSRDVKAEMKVIKVDGHLPGEAGYRLH